MEFKGIDLSHPINRTPGGKVSLAVNIRAYDRGSFTLRSLLTDAILTVSAAIQTLARLNDTTPSGPPSGYTLIISAGSSLYSNDVEIATGLSGNPVSLVTFRPNTSVQPWMYVADLAPEGTVSLNTKYLTTGADTFFSTNGMMKVRSDGLVYKMGIKEPQLAPIVSTSDVTTSGNDIIPATSFPWTNVGGQNTTNYGYGHTSATDGTPPVIVTGGGFSLVAGSTIVLTVTGAATVNGSAGVAPGASGPTTGAPGQYISTPKIVVGAFTDALGNVLAPGGSLPVVFNIGAGTTLTVPANAAQLQIGIDSVGNTFSANSGNYALSWQVTINPVSTYISTVGQVIAYVWGTPPPTGGGSPHSGPIAAYNWKNPNDTGTGTDRSITNPVPDAAPTNNSWILQAPAQVGGQTQIVAWTDLNPDGSSAGTIPLFTPALESQGYQDFNCCIVGSLFVPAAGTYRFTFTYKDQIMVGISGGVTAAYVSGAAANSTSPKGWLGQTISVVKSLPLLFVSNLSGSTSTAQTTAYDFTFPDTGIYDVEVDWDYWDKFQATMIMQVTSGSPNSPTIPPIGANVRQNVQYRYVYRSSATGAVSNPSPESVAQSVPVIANGVSSYWSPDPQVDVVDYYRVDLETENFTYVATGPNDNAGGGGTNTPIVDLLTDLELSGRLLDLDNFEPFPSIDLPQKGTCSISGGTITWLTGGSIGGSETGFNLRWLAGTAILIGSPTSIEYTFIARPTTTTSVTIPGVPDATNVAYEIPEPILANQPLPYLFGPTDNINFTFAVGDELRPGTLYWCKGSNLDSAPDTNQMDVTDPGEALVNGDMSGGKGVLFSIKRAWVIMPNFFNAQATVTGTAGSTWSLQDTSINRGLFIPRCVAVEGGGKIFFRVDDGIHFSPGGLASQSITDEDLYPLFKHEGKMPVAITRNGVTIYPPDDSQPQRQKFKVVNGFLYYDYVGMDSGQHTLVFDITLMAWTWDAYQWPATAHATNEAFGTQGTLAGCADGTVRRMASGGSETASANLITPAIGGAGFQHMRNVNLEYTSSAPITLTFIVADAGNGSYPPLAITIPSSGGASTKYNIDVSANKWKWLQFQFQSSDPTFQVFLDGFVVLAKDWGSEQEYRKVQPFAPSGGYGGQA